jgi:hypothetical protein
MSGELAAHLNLPLPNLVNLLARHDRAADVYCYVIATIAIREGKFVQTGSAPNFQGDLITLCTCKHWMRTRRSPGNWKDKWIAGFAGGTRGDLNALVYLMRVKYAFESHYDLWISEHVPEVAKGAKSAYLHNLGDVYMPKPGSNDDHKFSADCYESPTPDHVHSPELWRKDIEYIGLSGRPAALLTGDPEFSYLWNWPQTYSREPIGRGYRKPPLGKFRAWLLAAGSP